MGNIGKIVKTGGLSELGLSKSCNLSRVTVHKVLTGDDTVSLKNYNKVMAEISKNIKEVDSEFSIVAVSLKIENDKNWKIHLFDFVDYFRKNPSKDLIQFAPIKRLSEKETALLASVVHALCAEKNIEVPSWVLKKYWLKDPWFVSGFKSLMATTIQESPVYFRKNNIWVLSNFLNRA